MQVDPAEHPQLAIKEATQALTKRVESAEAEAHAIRQVLKRVQRELVDADAVLARDKACRVVNEFFEVEERRAALDGGERDE